MDKGVIQLAKTALTAKSRQHVTLADILAVCERESHCVPVFTERDNLYRVNLKAASQITGLAEVDLVKALIIPVGVYKNYVAKFRCEPGYWKWAKEVKGSFTQPERFLLSCSIGVGQKMTRWLVTGTPKQQWIPGIKHFMGSVATQLLYVAGDLDRLIDISSGDRKLAYTRYNAGPGAKQHTEYGDTTYRRYEQIKQTLELEHDIK
jgi:hypothetical protein